MLAQATIPSFLRYGAYPYIVVVREQIGGRRRLGRGRAPLRRPVHRRRDERQRARDSADLAPRQRRARDGPARPEPSRAAAARHHPDHPALGAVRAERPANCSTWRWRSSISVRAAARCCSCGPTRSPTSCRAWCTCRATATPPPCGWRCRTSWSVSSAGVSIDYAARVSESPWAVVHFTVLLPEGSRPAGRRRVRDRTRRASRTCSPRPRAPGVTGCSARSGPVRSTRPSPSTTPTAFPEVYKQAITPQHAINDIAIIEELQDNSVKLVFADSADDTRRSRRCLAPRLVPRRTIGVAEPAAADAAVHGRRGARGAAVHRDPSRRAAGVDLPVQDLAPPRHPRGAARTGTRGHRGSASPTPSPRSGTASAEIDRFNELVLRAGLTWQQVAILRTYAKYLRQAGFPVQPVPHRDGAQRQRRHRRARWSHCSRRCSAPPTRLRAPRTGTPRPPPPPSPPTSTRWSAWTPTGCCGRSPR